MAIAEHIILITGISGDYRNNKGRTGNPVLPLLLRLAKPFGSAAWSDD